MDMKGAVVFAEGRSSLEALLQTPRCVGLHPSFLPLVRSAGEAVSSGDCQVSRSMSVKRMLGEGLKGRGALASGRLSSKGYPGNVWEGRERCEIKFN